jgi:hypothetical protein
MTLSSAIDVIENCHGFDEETSGVGEAWAVVKSYLPNSAWAELARLREAVREAREYVRGFIPLTEHMSELDAAMFVEDARIWLERMDCAATLHTPAPERP